MRKFFSLIAAVLFAGSMMAQVTITPSALTAAESTEINATIEGVSLNITQGTVTADQIRIFKNQTITISAESNISSIEFTCTANGTAKYGPGCFNAQDGYTFEADGKKGTWVGSATSVTFTAESNQVRASQIVVTLEGGEVVPPTPADTYTVAGSDAAIFGEAWNPALTTNDMTLANGVYTWTKAQLNLTAGTIEFKVVKNHSWDIAYPAQNYVLNIAEDGEYTITITFDPTTETVAAEAVKNEPLADPTNCVEAAAAAMSVSANNELYNDGAVYTIEGYVTGIKTAYSDQYHNISFWMADAADGGEVLQAYRAACASEADAPQVGDKVAVTGSLTKYNTTPEFAAGCTYVIIPVAPVEEDGVIYDWAGEIGTTVLGATGVEVSTVKIHTNTDAVPAIKFGSSFVYADGKWLAIKPAKGGFKAGDVLSVAAVFNNADDTKYAQIDLRAANGDTRIWLSDSASTINGRTQAGEPIVQTYTLEADQDSLFLGRYGNTGMFVTLINVVRGGEVVPPTPEHTYTVAGSSAELFGTAWTPSIEDNDMVKQEDGSYKFEKTGLELAAGIIEFKVCEDHAWTNCWPAQNYQLSIAESGIYTITITFDADTKEILASAQKTGEAVVIPSVAMHGNFLGSWADTENFAVAEGDATASLTLNLAAGNYEFGMRIGGSGNWTSNGVAFTRENNAAEVVAGQGNLTLAADVAGDYVFTWTFATNSLAITYPEAPVAADTIVIDIEQEVQYTDYVAQAGWWQFMAENDEYEISISNLSTTQAAGTYTIADLDADYTYLLRVADSTEIHFVAGSFVLTEGADGSRTIEGVVTGDDDKIYSIKLVFRIPTPATTVNVEIPEWAIGDASKYYNVTGYIFAGETADESIYVQLVIPGSNPLGTFTYDDCYAGATGIEVGGKFKPIYSMDVTVNVSDAQRAIITMDILCYNNTLYHVTTLVGEGVDAIEAAEKAVKMIQNGNVVIIKNGVHYNVNGQVIK